MNAVSCVSATWCMAIGKFTTGDAWQFETFEVLHGSWIVEARTPPTPKGATEFDLSSISCTSESACTATGYYSAEERVKTLAYRWNGSSWSQQNTLNPSEGGAGEAMLSVSCASASLCMAVGEAASKPLLLKALERRRMVAESTAQSHGCHGSVARWGLVHGVECVHGGRPLPHGKRLRSNSR